MTDLCTCIYSMSFCLLSSTLNCGRSSPSLRHRALAPTKMDWLLTLTLVSVLPSHGLFSFHNLKIFVQVLITVFDVPSHIREKMKHGLKTYKMLIIGCTTLCMLSFR